MRYLAIGQSDTGTNKTVNQDSLLIRCTRKGKKHALMAIICDGVGGLAHGDIASAAVTTRFDEWFSRELPRELKKVDMDIISEKWALLLKTLNVEIQECAYSAGEKRGTTFTGVLFIDDQFLVVHVGDTRFYHIDSSVIQLSQDHTLVAREVACGRLTLREARVDKRKNLLLQCVGASRAISPQIIRGTTAQGIYMLCSDGFRHKVAEDEMYDVLKPEKLRSKWNMRRAIRALINLNRKRKEKDDISAIIIRPTRGIF